MIRRCRKYRIDKSAVADYCVSCGTPTKIKPSRNTGFSTAGGVLAIAATSVCIWVGAVGFYASTSRLGYYLGYSQFPLLIMGIFGSVGFAFGLVGGIFALRRTHFAFAMLGSSLILVSGIVDMVVFAPKIAMIGELFGLPNIILSSLSLILIALSKAEFIKETKPPQ
jgi:hypothetical protein